MAKDGKKEGKDTGNKDAGTDKPVTEAPPEQLAPTPQPEETVEVKRSELNSILDRLGTLEEEGAKKDSEIERLTSAADIGRLQRFDESRGKKLIRTASLAVWKDNIVIGWKMVKDDVRLRGNQVIADQVIELYTLDAENEPIEPEKVDYTDFTRNVGKVVGDIITKVKDETDEKELYVLKFKDGREIKVDIAFINAF